MIIDRTYIIVLLGISLACIVESVYNVKKLTGPIGKTLETPNWSVEEQALYFIDAFTTKFYRYNETTGKITTKKIGCGSLGLITLVKKKPNYVILGINSSLYVVNFNAPNIEISLRLLTTVDLGEPDNSIHDAKADAAGRLWFGTLGKPLGPTAIVPGEGSLYVITNATYMYPRVALSALSLSDGLVWSLDNKYFYHNDAPSRMITRYDFDLETGKIANGQVFFDFNENDIEGFPNGMTIDTDGNIWVATFSGAEILRIDTKTKKLLLRIKIPRVDTVTSVIWGGINFDKLYFTTGAFMIEKPQPDSGSLQYVKVKGCRGRAQDFLQFDNIENY